MTTKSFVTTIAVAAIVAAGITVLTLRVAGLDTVSFDARVHTYLIKHPSVLFEMQTALRQQAAQSRDRRVQTHLAEIDHNPGDPEAGNPNGTVTIAEWFDYQCPYCKAEAPVLAHLIRADPHVRVVFKMFPIIGGPGSVVAAEAALAALKQGSAAFLRFHTALLADRTPEDHLAAPRIFAIAKSVGLDVARLKRDMQAPAIKTRIKANVNLAREIDIDATPGLVIGDHLHLGYIPYPRLLAMVQAAEHQTGKAAKTAAAPAGH